MTGAEEAPGPGDPDATGQADFQLNQGQGRICFDLSWENIDGTVFAAHIHLAPVGAPGDIVVPLFEGTFAGTDSVSDCVDAERSLVKDIRKHPSDYYVNVHSMPGFEAGADSRATERSRRGQGDGDQRTRPGPGGRAGGPAAVQAAPGPRTRLGSCSITLRVLPRRSWSRRPRNG